MSPWGCRAQSTLCGPWRLKVSFHIESSHNKRGKREPGEVAMLNPTELVTRSPNLSPQRATQHVYCIDEAHLMQALTANCHCCDVAHDIKKSVGFNREARFFHGFADDCRFGMLTMVNPSPRQKTTFPGHRMSPTREPTDTSILHL